ncbi:MAG: glycosyltransferase family 4 protein [bacterium]
MKVLHILPMFFGDYKGGGERYSLELAKAMSQVVETELISFSERPRVEKIGSLTVRLFKPWFYIQGQKISPVYLPFLWALKNADIIHCYQYHTLTTSLSILWGKLLRKRVFVTDFGGGGWDMFSYHGGTWRFIDGFIHLSEYAAGCFSKYKTSHYIVYGGVDIRKFYPLNLNRERKILFVGRLLPHKGIHYLIEAVDSDITLTIIGRPYSLEYFEYLKNLSKVKKVEFIIDATDEILLQEYNKASVFVLPSVYKTMYGGYTEVPELLGLVVLEAMACKTPVIVTNVASLPELVKDEETGFIVKPNSPLDLKEKIYKLINEPQRVYEMGEKAYQLFREKFTWNKTVEKVLQAYGS